MGVPGDNEALIKEQEYCGTVVVFSCCYPRVLNAKAMWGSWANVADLKNGQPL